MSLNKDKLAYISQLLDIADKTRQLPELKAVTACVMDELRAFNVKELYDGDEPPKADKPAGYDPNTMSYERGTQLEPQTPKPALMNEIPTASPERRT